MREPAQLVRQFITHGATAYEQMSDLTQKGGLTRHCKCLHDLHRCHRHKNRRMVQMLERVGGRGYGHKPESSDKGTHGYHFSGYILYRHAQ